MGADYRALLEDLDRVGRRRHLAPRLGFDFASNDYLGLAQSDELARAVVAAIERGVAVGAGGSRLLRGNHPEHEQLEADAAGFFGTQSALYFPTGFTANSALFATLPQRGDIVIHDELIHASVHDGLKSGRADVIAARHNDPQAVDDAIRCWRAAGGRGRPWIAVESLYSMDGDRAPLDDLARLAQRHDAMLVIDEAHATGVWGEGGRGLATALAGQAHVITLHTCGKALGAAGALLCLPTLHRDFLINRCRPFIYSTAPSPLMAATVRAALTICHGDDARRQRLLALIAVAGALLEQASGERSTASQIKPVLIGDDRRAIAVASRLQAAGFDVRAIRPPTVPPGTARLRITVTLNVDEAAIAALADALGAALRAERVPAP